MGFRSLRCGGIIHSIGVDKHYLEGRCGQTSAVSSTFLLLAKVLKINNSLTVIDLDSGLQCFLCAYIYLTMYLRCNSNDKKKETYQSN